MGLTDKTKRWVKETLDWRLVVSIIVLMLVATACWGFVARQRENQSLADAARRGAVTIHSLNEKVDDLTAQLAKQRVEQKQANAKATAQRIALRKQNRQLSRALQGLLQVLKDNGITVPQGFISNLGTGGSRGSKPRKRHHAAPQGPGNSGPHPCAHSRKC